MGDRKSAPFPEIRPKLTAVLRVPELPGFGSPGLSVHQPFSIPDRQSLRKQPKTHKSPKHAKRRTNRLPAFRPGGCESGFFTRSLPLALNALDH